MPNEIRLNPTSRYRSNFSCVTESGCAANVISQSVVNPLRALIALITRPKSSAGNNDGVPPPKKIVGAGSFGAAYNSRSTASM
jgi:hypothetical protein